MESNDIYTRQVFLYGFATMANRFVSNYLRHAVCSMLRFDSSASLCAGYIVAWQAVLLTVKVKVKVTNKFYHVTGNKGPEVE
jgi:hypothetical protein